MKILLSDQLEDLLIKNWSKFIDHKKLIALILEQCRKNEFPVQLHDEIKITGFQMKLSRCTPETNGFTVWVEFTFPTNQNEVTTGTTEAHLALEGEFTARKTIGTIFRRK